MSRSVVYSGQKWKMNALSRHKVDSVVHPSADKARRAGSGGGGPRACRACAVAKAKCIPSESERSKCERCGRLKKECVLQESKARKKRNVGPRKTRVAQLEQKLDNIVSLLKSSHDAPEDQDQEMETTDMSQPSNPTTYSTLSSATSMTKSSSTYPAVQQSHLKPPQHTCENMKTSLMSPTPGTLPPRTQPPLLYGRRTSQNEPETSCSSSEQESYLALYRNSMAPYFPFVVIGDKVSAQELRQTKPFLLEVILVAAFYKDSGRQSARGKGVVEHVTRRMLFDGEKSLDLLQGLLVYIAWYLNLFYTGRQMTNLLQLAIALVADLGLNQPPQIPLTQKTVPEVMRMILQGSKSMDIVRGTLEERRAFLGCFYLSSMITSHLRGLEPLPYTSYVKECCQCLLDAREHPDDAYLVELIQIQRVVNLISQHVHSDTADMSKPRALFGMHIAAIQQQLNSVKEPWGENVHNKGLLLMHFHSAEVYLYEFAINDSIARSRNTLTEADPFQQVELLYACLEATQFMMDAFLTIQPNQYVHINMVPWLQVGRTTIAMRKLCFLDVPGWDVKLIRDKLDVPALLDRVIKNATDASLIVPRGGGGDRQFSLRADYDDDNEKYVYARNDMLAEFARKMLKAKMNFIEAIQLEQEGQAPSSSSQIQPGQQVHPPVPGPGPNPAMNLQQPPLAGEMWTTGGETLFSMDDDFWQGFWQEWQYI